MGGSYRKLTSWMMFCFPPSPELSVLQQNFQTTNQAIPPRAWLAIRSLFPPFLLVCENVSVVADCLANIQDLKLFIQSLDSISCRMRDFLSGARKQQWLPPITQKKRKNCLPKSLKVGNMFQLCPRLTLPSIHPSSALL